MTKRSTAILPKGIAALIGRWSAADEWATNVELVISSSGGKIRVRAVDKTDGEEAEVMEVRTTKDTITFAAYWSSG
ncbi:MAG: hypothetical protein HOP13_18485 [Alphaproteobacteria bacterium]|nr:hypothetical protein [Alphaproteobacteria bacterium]